MCSKRQLSVTGTYQGPAVCQGFSAWAPLTLELGDSVWWGCPEPWQTFSSIPGLHPLPARGDLFLVTTENGPRHCHMSPLGFCPQVENHYYSHAPNSDILVNDGLLI